MEDLTGKQFGAYQIVAPLGEGGMAAVYKAYQPSMERYVALKVLPRQFASDPEFTARFQREAKLLAKLQHSHILPVFDYGQSDGYTYIVMPFVQSGTLTDLLKGQPLPPAQIRKIIGQIGDALNYAHAHGLIHRDVKPSNVLIDEGGNCLLTDFGLARMVEASVNITNSGAILGTPAYMSPEQGSGLKIDARSDIYSLGVILYELATGRVPYKAETPIAVVFKHIQDPLPPARELNPDLDEAIELVILKALSKRPEDRYQTAGELVAALQVATTGTFHNPIPLQKVSTGTVDSVTQVGLSTKVRRLNWVVVTGLLICFASTIAGFLYIQWKDLPVLNAFFQAHAPTMPSSQAILPIPTNAISEQSTATFFPTVSPTLLPTQLPTQLLLPQMNSFMACLEQCTGSNAANQFPEAIKKIYVQWNYENIPEGSRYERKWTMNGLEWIRYECNWPGPVSGTAYTALEEIGGLHSGQWEITILVDGQTLLQESLVVQGSWDYWDPAGTLYTCFGKVSP